MKKLATLFVLFALLASCEIIIVEPAYDPRDSLLGQWEIEEYSETYNYSSVFTIHIDKSSVNYDEVRIHNFYDVDITVIGWVESNKIIIPLQIINGFEVEGIATIRNGELSFSYSVFDRYRGGFTDYCYATAW